jgi:hypothetical protein
MQSKILALLLSLLLFFSACGGEETKQEKNVNAFDSQSLPTTKEAEESYVEKEYVEPQSQTNPLTSPPDSGSKEIETKLEMKMNLKVIDSSKLKKSSEVEGLEKEY